MPQGVFVGGREPLPKCSSDPRTPNHNGTKVYSLKHELPIFSMGSNLVAYENQLREVMAGKAAKALERMTEARAT
jgi:hypothetical protein